MIAAEENLRHLHAAKVLRPRVVRVFQQPLAEGIIGRRILIAEGPFADLQNRASLPGSSLEEVFLLLTEEILDPERSGASERTT